MTYRKAIELFELLKDRDKLPEMLHNGLYNREELEKELDESAKKTKESQDSDE